MTYGIGVITPVPTKAGVRYRVRIPDGQGGYKSLGVYDTHEEAERMRDAGLVAAADVETLSGITLYAYGERWLSRCAKAAMRDVGSMRSRWKTIVANAPFAQHSIESITRTDVRDWARTLMQQSAKRSVARGGKRTTVETGRSLSWASAKHALGMVARALDEAREEGLVRENVARGIKLPRREETKEAWTWLTPEEIATVLALDLTLEQRTAITVAAYQGLRLGELAALTWEHVTLDGERPALVVAASWKRGTKSGKVRRIPLLDPARFALLRWQPDRDKRAGLVFPSPKGGMYSKGYCWTWEGGHYRDGEGNVKHWLGVRERAGLKRRVRWHDLRHTCAANLVSGSWGRAWRLEEVRAFLGHSSITTTQIYAHLAPEALHATARATAAQPPVSPPEPVTNLTEENSVDAPKPLKSLARPEGFEPRERASGKVASCRELVELSEATLRGSVPRPVGSPNRLVPPRAS